MEKERYIIVKGSVSGHCCFDYSIVDSEQKEQDWGVDNKVICETFYKEDADLICNSLNKYKQ